jgi:hypothetical protein
MRVFKFGGASIKDAEGIKTFTMFYKSRFWGCIVSGFRYGKNNKCSWVVIRTILINHPLCSHLSKKSKIPQPNLVGFIRATKMKFRCSTIPLFRLRIFFWLIISPQLWFRLRSSREFWRINFYHYIE